MNANLYLHALLYSQLPLARTEKQLEAVVAKYRPI
jgi:hypothetical protein